MAGKKATRAQTVAVADLRNSLKVVHERVSNIKGVKNPSKELLQRRTDVFAVNGVETKVDITASKGDASHDKYFEYIAEHGRADSVVKLMAALLAPLMSEVPLRGLYMLVAISDQLDKIVPALKELNITFPKGVGDYRYLSALVLAAEIQVTSSSEEFESALDIFHRAADSPMSIEEESFLDFELE